MIPLRSVALLLLGGAIGLAGCQQKTPEPKQAPAPVAAPVPAPPVMGPAPAERLQSKEQVERVVSTAASPEFLRLFVQSLELPGKPPFTALPSLPVPAVVSPKLSAAAALEVWKILHERLGTGLQPVILEGALFEALVQAAGSGPEPQMTSPGSADAFFARREAALADAAVSRRELEAIAAAGLPGHGAPPAPATFALAGKPGPQVVVLVVQCEPARLPALLRFGGTDDRPSAAEHGAVWAEWARRFGALPVFLGSHALEFMVERPPSNLADLRTLTWQHRLYGEEAATPDRSLVARAGRLAAARSWAFTWK